MGDASNEERGEGEREREKKFKNGWKKIRSGQIWKLFPLLPNRAIENPTELATSLSDYCNKLHIRDIE